MSDLLRMDYINSLPQPFITVAFFGGDEWPLYDIDVETGLLRIDVCGKPEIRYIGEVKEFIDAEGVIHNVDILFCDCEPSNPKSE